MQLKSIALFLITTLLIACNPPSPTSDPSPKTLTESTPRTDTFNIEKDLLIGAFDCKTDVDDLHSVAAFTTLLSSPSCSKVKHHAVAGTYGTQEGLYVPPNDLFQLAFGDNWSDAHKNRARAISQVKTIALRTLKRFHVVQHSNWNEEVTSPESLAFVKANTAYHKIADGNTEGNGTPGFNDGTYKDWSTKVTNPKLRKIWQLAIDLGNKYNGKDKRYLNESIQKGGLDFSDVSETCWILGIEEMKDIEAFFKHCQ